MNELTVFNNPAFGQVRTVTVDGEPWFVGRDVAKALGYNDNGKAATNAVSKHVDPEDKGVTEIVTPGGTQDMTIINESGLYSLILSSKLPTAKAFKRWVTSEVLPAIRKTGMYARDQPLDYLQAARLLTECRREDRPYLLELLRKGGYLTGDSPPIEPPKRKRRYSRSPVDWYENSTYQGQPISLVFFEVCTNDLYENYCAFCGLTGKAAASQCYFSRILCEHFHCHSQQRRSNGTRCYFFVPLDD